MKLANLENDAWFLNLVTTGALIVHTTGKIYSTKLRKYLGYYSFGYVILSVYDADTGKTRKMRAHRLVYLASNGLIYDNTLVVHHVDTIRDHNWLTNLELATQDANIAYAKEARGFYTNRALGELNCNSKLSNASVCSIRKRYSEGGISCKALAARYHVSLDIVAKVISSRTYKSVVSGFEELCIKRSAINRKLCNIDTI